MHRPIKSRIGSIGDYYREAFEKIKGEILSRADDYILGVKEEEYSEYLYNKYELPKIEKDPIRDIAIEQERKWETSMEFRREIKRQFVTARIEYPLVYHPMIDEVLGRQSSMWQFMPRIQYENGTIILRSEPEPTAIEISVNELVRLLEEENKDVEKGNAELRQNISKFIKARIEQLKKDREVFEKAVQQVSIPLKLKNPGQLPVIDISIKKQLVLMPPKAEKPKEFFLKKTHVLTILEMVSKIGLQFEVTPKVFNGLRKRRCGISF